MIVGARDAFGSRRLLYHPATGHTGERVRDVLAAAGVRQVTPDRDAIAGHLYGPRHQDRTLIKAVRAVPPGHALVRGSTLHLRRLPPASRAADLRTALQTALAAAFTAGKRVALALSGGLDSALLLALLHAQGREDVPVYVLATGMPDYCEREAALAMAQRLGASVRVVTVQASDFVDALPRVLREVEEPLFNLHPVAKRLLAEAMARDGIDLAITGDGADQVLRRDASANYLPLCQALFDTAGVRWWPPFLAPGVVRHLCSQPPDADKACLRALGAQLALPDVLVQGPKRSRLAPAMDLDSLDVAARIPPLARALDVPAPALETDRERVLWTTLVMTLDLLTPEPTPP